MINFDYARKKAARSSKLNAVGIQEKPKQKPTKLQQTVRQLPGWLGHIHTPDIQFKIEHLITLSIILSVILASYHLHPILTYSDWFQGLMNMVGYAAFVFVISCGYGIYWTVKTKVNLRFTLLHIAIISLCSAPIFFLSGFNGGILGLSITQLFEHGHIHKSIIAASAMLTIIYSSIHLGNPLVKLISLTEILVDLFFINRAETKNTQTKASDTNALIQPMQKILDTHKLDYAKVVHVYLGPLITTYEIQLPEGKSAKSLLNAKNSIARSCKAIDVKIIEHIAGKSTCAIEICNTKAKTFTIHSLTNTKAFKQFKARLKVCLGVDSYGIPVYEDMCNLLHILVSGTTGAGKSVAIRSLLYSLMLFQKPTNLQLSLIDPKQVELSAFENSPFLRHPIITDMSEASYVLEAAVKEMEERYTLINSAHKQNIEEYNEQTKSPLPWVVIVIEEMADLILQYPEVEAFIARLTQKARGAGLLVMIGTQYPTVKVITGLIKANLSTRLAMMVTSKIESRVILDQNGAETLRGSGDTYAKLPGRNALTRIHTANISQKDITKLIKKQIKQYGKPKF